MTFSLQLTNAVIGYGKSVVLDRIDFSTQQGATVGLVGRNGAGKTTLLSALMGLLPFRDGQYTINDSDCRRFKPHQLCRLGISYVPADRQIFGTLTVEENLKLAQYSLRSGPWDLARVYALFPILKERRRGLAANLSGGEKQMLAMGRGVLANPLLLLLDEPTEGLAPLIVRELIEAIDAIRREGVSIVVVEQNLHAITALLTEAYVLESGRVVWRGQREKLMAEMDVVNGLIGF